MTSLALRIGLVVLASSPSCWAQWPWSSQQGAPNLAMHPMLAMQQGPSAMPMGVAAEMAGDLATAATHYEQALKKAESQHPFLRDDALRSALPKYGRTLMMLGRLPEAEVALERLAALAATPKSAAGEMGFAELRQVMASGMKLAQEGSRGMNLRLVVDGKGSDALDTALAFRLPLTEVPAVLLAELRLRQGRLAEVPALWKGEFAKYLQAVGQQREELRVVTDDEAVVASWHMALALHAAGADAEAHQAMATALDFDAQRLRRWTAKSPSPDVQLGAFQQRRWLAASAVQIALPKKPGLQSAEPSVRLALGAIASSKALYNRYGERRRALLATLGDRTVRQARAQIGELESQIAQLPTEGERGLEAWVNWSNQYAQALMPALQALEKAGLPSVVADAEPLLRRVQAALAPEEVLVGFFVMQPLSLQTLRPEAARYVRYTLSAAGASLRDVGDRRAVDRQVASWRSAGDAARQLATGLELVRDLLTDLPPEVASAKRWVVDPDGMLALLPFEALPESSGDLLLERRALRYVTSLAQLADPPLQPANSKLTALVLADPKFVATAAAGISGALPLRTASGRGWRDMVFKPLPETRVEGEAVRDKLRAMGVDTIMLSGADATPDALRQAAAPTYLHIASHGFLLSAAPEADPQALHRLRMMVPGMLAGLALAPDSRGSVLTGTDLASMNLRGTRLVVLSACDTGNGSIDVHEGLTSLRRAAEEAGARATVTSLWPVPSEITVRLMSHLYSELARGQTHSEALRSAKLELLRGGASVRDWAGFVLAGADR